MGTLSLLGDAHERASAEATGMQAEIPVPKPGSDSTCSVPARLSMRWRMATRPKPPLSGLPAVGWRRPSLTLRPLAWLTGLWAWVLVVLLLLPVGLGGLGAESREVEALAVVAHVQGDLVLHVREGDPDPGGLRVAGHVGQRLLRGAQQRELGF